MFVYGFAGYLLVQPCAFTHCDCSSFTRALLINAAAADIVFGFGQRRGENSKTLFFFPFSKTNTKERKQFGRELRKCCFCHGQIPVAFGPSYIVDIADPH